MALRIPNKELKPFEYTHLKSNYDDSNIHSASHGVDLPTNFNLQTITLEDIDQGVYREFNKRFTIRDKQMPLISMDAEVSSITMQNYEQYDKDKGFLNGPFFLFTRTKTSPMYRTSPSNKSVVYAIPQNTSHGVVYKEYITEGPQYHELHYDFKFVTDYRDSINQMETQMMNYFRNKRNVIVINNERFSIGPEQGYLQGELQVVNREDAAQRTMYSLSYALKLYCFTRDLSKMQVRQRPNTYSVDMVVKDDLDNEISSEHNTIQIEKYDIDLTDYPKHP